MKKRMYLLTLSCVLLLGACAATDTNKLIIPELSERETQILETAADKAFVFDYTADQNYKEISLWVEKYENGKRTEDPINEFTTQLPGETTHGSIILTISQTLDQQLLFSASIHSVDGTARINNQATIDSLDQMVTIWGANPQQSLPLSNDMLLAGVIYTVAEAGESTSTLSADFYEQEAGYLDELKAYDVVYLLRVSFN